MKNIFSLLSVLLFALTCSAATNQPTLAEAAKQTVATNINEVMVQMLSGVKDASGEIYRFSKQEVAHGYDFIKDQAPQVVKEFLLWKIAESCVWLVVWITLACVFFFFARKLSLAAPTMSDEVNRDAATAGKWAGRIVACGIIIVAVGVHAMTITKCVVAPRVYIIEYVVDLCKGQS